MPLIKLPQALFPTHHRPARIDACGVPSLFSTSRTGLTRCVARVHRPATLRDRAHRAPAPSAGARATDGDAALPE